MPTIKKLRAALYALAALVILLGLWGLLSNIAVPLVYGKQPWNFFEAFEVWDEPAASAGKRPPPFRFPWWAISWQTPCPYLDPCLAGPVGYGFYSLCLSWGLGTVLILGWCLRSVSTEASWPVFLFWGWWLTGLAGVIAHLAFFASVAIEARRLGLC